MLCSLPCSLLCFLLFSKGCIMASKWLQHGFKMAPTWLQNCANMAPKSLLEASSRVTKSVQAAFRLWEASWSAPGGLQSRKKIVQEGPGPVPKKIQDRFQPKEIHLNPSWPVLKKFQDRFQRSWGPKDVPKAAQEGPNSGSSSDSRPKLDIFKKYCFFHGIP